MDKIKFSKEDQNSRELARGILLQWLKEGRSNQFPRGTESFEDKVDFIGNRHLAQENFLSLAQEIFWELIIQGVLTPGLNSSNPNLPFFRVTEYGRKVLSDQGYIPHDPTGYLVRYAKEIGAEDAVILKYLEESLRNFTSGCYLSAHMMLGIASERIFLHLCDNLFEALEDAQQKQDFGKILQRVSMVTKFEFVQKKMEEILESKRKDFPSNIRTALFGVCEFFRFQRNDIGHPQDDLQVPEREEVYISLRIFPQYCKTINQAIIFLDKYKV